MIIVKLFKVLIFLFFSVLACNSSFSDVNVKKLNKYKWIEVKTDNYHVITNATEKNALKMIKDIENFHYFVADLLNTTKTTFKQRVPIILAKNSTSISSLGIPKDYSGVFVRRQQEEVIFANAQGFRSADRGSSNGRSTVLHELVHLFLYGVELPMALPPWYNEGIAEYLGTYRERSGKILLGDMTILQHRFYTLLDPLNKVKGIDSESLFNVDQAGLSIKNKNTSSESKFLSKFYARSVAVIHYLNSDPARRNKMYQYLFLLKKGYAVEETFSHVFKMSFSEFDDLVEDYINGRTIVARGFNIGKGGIEFPAVEYEVNSLESRNAMIAIVDNISYLSDTFLGEGTRDAMYTDLEALYPGILE